MNKNIQDYLNQNKGESFNKTLFSYIDERGYKDSDVYKKAGIDRKLFSKIRCNKNYIPRKRVIIRLCLALRLDKKNTDVLLNSAGYSLSRNDNFDLVISYFLESKNYNLNTINSYLYTFANTAL